MDMPIDHFSYEADNATFKYRYFYNMDSYSPDSQTPIIFLYTGNEGELESFYYNTGFAFRLAKKFQGINLFCEHRYYGKSLPYGDKDSFTTKNLKYLSVEQALNDFADCLENFKTEKKISEDTRVVALGGSYGGVLTLLMRIKYPNLIDVGYAASAPMKEVYNQADPTFFFDHITNVYRGYDEKCPDITKSAFNDISMLFTTSAGRDQLKTAFSLCSVPAEADKTYFMNYVRNAYVEIAMCNYPYPANFLTPLPGYPLKTACKKTLVSDKKGNKIDGLVQVRDMAYAVEDGKCHDFKQEYVLCSDLTGCGEGLSAKSWEYQACTQVPLPASSTGKNDMFFDATWTIDEISTWCKSTFNVIPDPAKFSIQMGGLDYASVTSNVIFTNGDLDPWSDGGFNGKDLSEDIKVFVVEGGAHHLDLREDNEQDPVSVKEVRNKIENYIQTWLFEVEDDDLHFEWD